jgi:hypothetical protein
MTSFDVLLVPQAFRARTRTKYVPGAATAVRDEAVLPVTKFAMSVAPEADPASTTYVVTGPVGAVHDNTTV